MNEENNCVGNYKKPPWYKRDVFPLLPILILRQGDEHNTSGFTFRWLFIKLWSLDSPSFELSLVCCSHWGFGVVGILPYLRWTFTIPFPFGWKWHEWEQKYLWRKPKKQ